MSVFYWLLLIGFWQAPAQDSHPNFTGVWKVNDTRTVGRNNEAEELIDQQDDTCNIQYYIRQLDFVPFSNFVMDGKLKIKGDATTSAHWEGSTLILDTKSTAYGHTSTSHEALTLSDDGKVLTKVVDSRRDDVPKSTKIVFDRSNSSKPNSFQVGSEEADVIEAWGQPNEITGDKLEKTYIYFNWKCGRLAACQTVIVAGGRDRYQVEHYRIDDGSVLHNRHRDCRRIFDGVVDSIMRYHS